MQRYRKKPETVQGLQLTHGTWDEMVDFVSQNAPSPQNFLFHILAEEASDTCGEDGPDYLAFVVTDSYGVASTVRHGDWVIPDDRPGTFIKLTPNEFAAKYEALEEPD